MTRRINMVDKQKLIEALRCSSKSGSNCKGEKCPYYYLEEVNPDLPVPCDVHKDGKCYWASCDVGRMAMDAADMLEAL